jgi:hypothetical protein
MNDAHAGHRPRLTVAGLVALAGAVAVLVVSGPGAGRAATEHTHAATEPSHGAVVPVQTTKAVRFHDDMRKLWEDHITWTRLAIVSFAGGLPDFDPTAARLLRNQTDLGNAIKPYYGRKAGERLTALLKVHIAGAVELLKAAKAGDDVGFAAAKDAWYRNGRQIARFLSSANPRFLPFARTDRLMKGHLDDTLDEAAHRLGGDFDADIRDYEHIHHHILRMSDAISNGIIRQFPARFR